MKNKLFDLITINSKIIFGICINILGIVFNTLVPLAVKNFIDQNSKGNIDLNWSYIIFILLLLQAIFTSIGTFMITREGDKQIADIRLKIKEHLLELPTSFFDNIKSGEISSRVINDTTSLRSFLTLHIPQMVNGVITISVSFIILMLLDWKLAILLCLIFPLHALIAIPIGKINEKIANRTQGSISKLIGYTSENLSNIRTIKLNNAEKGVYYKFKLEINNLYSLSVKADRVFAITQPIQRIFAIALIIVVILYGGFRVSQGTLTAGTLISFMIFLFQLIGPINSVADFYNNYKQAKGSTEKIFSIINTRVENDEKASLKIQSILKPYSLSLKNANFAYNDREILKNVNMSFNAGEKIAIVGATGSGKSTIINLITRLYPLKKGMLDLNQQDATEIKLDNWRSLFGVVSQENTIFTGSILDNLTFGLNYLPTEEKIQEALTVANLYEDIANLPNGVQTLIGERGLKLSGGQRQRLQIARAYLKDAAFLILDEATSSLDSYSEKIISDNLKNYLGNKTLISIAHRLSTIVDADRIYFLENNKIKDFGTHFELLQRVPKYKEFVEEQIIKTETSLENGTRHKII
ncbi:ABC transporter ATP-binding protein [Rossellomorea sp. YZS02]|uniref:ABC transporter ATP-binding protein n=1 Tax=Rossellomorea sp. YZS02 TaxID=3097358 RepID=UPI002A1367B9|nr:ABC transporter ATP-binding protein [Rossellomorea sp. YZS02]MDX8344166.1 ABC transporter ATP-binding protein [Rossellomorea sp. YZS02]